MYRQLDNSRLGICFFGCQRSSGLSREIENLWKRPRFFRKYFRFNLNAVLTVMKATSSKNLVALIRGLLLNPIHSDDEITNIVSNFDYKFCLRNVLFFECDFEDPTFDWFFIRRSVRAAGYDFDIDLKFLRGSGSRLKGVPTAIPDELKPENCMIVELLAFSRDEGRGDMLKEIRRISSVLFTVERAMVNGLLLELRLVKASRAIKIQKFERSIQNFGWFSMKPFDRIWLVTVLDNSTEDEFSLVRKVPRMNTREILENISFKSRGRLRYEITNFLIEAVELRYLGRESLAPILCHTAIENLVREAMSTLNLPIVKDETFKKKSIRLSDALTPNKFQVHLLNLYQKYVYEIRNSIVHTGAEVSRFLSDYCIYITVTWITEILKHERFSADEKFSTFYFPYLGLQESEIRNLTRELRSIYRDDLSRLVLMADDADDAFPE